MTNRSLIRSSLGAVAAMLAGGAGLSFVGAPGAGASATTLIVPSADAGRSAAAIPAVTKNNSFAGYRVTNAAGISSLNATMTVPIVTCPTTGPFSAYLSTQVAGATVSGGVFVHLECAGGVASYSGFVTFTTVTNGTKHFAVAAGDTLQSQMAITVSKKGKTAVHETVTDETSGVVTTKDVGYTGVATVTTGSDIVEHTAKATVPPFGTVSWTGATANGLSLAAAAATRYSMTRTGVTLVSASVLGATGSSFTNKFHASS